MLVMVSLTSVSLVAPVAAYAKSKPATVPQSVTTDAPKDASTEQPKVAAKPEKAKGPLADSVVVESHKSHWYKFHYHYNNSDNHSEPTEAMVKLTGEAMGCLTFQIWTAGGLQLGNGQKHKAIGAGSPMQEQSSVLLWVGGAAATEDYYVVVKNKTTAACAYQLSITGPDVSY